MTSHFSPISTKTQQQRPCKDSLHSRSAMPTTICQVFWIRHSCWPKIRAPIDSIFPFWMRFSFELCKMVLSEGENRKDLVSMWEHDSTERFWKVIQLDHGLFRETPMIPRRRWTCLHHCLDCGLPYNLLYLREPWWAIWVKVANVWWTTCGGKDIARPIVASCKVLRLYNLLEWNVIFVLIFFWHRLNGLPNVQTNHQQIISFFQSFYDDCLNAIPL